MESITKKKRFVLSLAITFILIGTVSSQVKEYQDNMNILLREKGPASEHHVSSIKKDIKKLDKISAVKENFQKSYKLSKSYFKENYPAIPQSILAEPSDSAYVYEWENKDWQLDTRWLYYYSGFTVEIIEEEKLPDGNTWEKSYKTEALHYESYDLQRETYSFWKKSTKEWVIVSFEEYNEFGLNTEYYHKIWNDTTQKFIDGVRITSTYENDTNRVERLLQLWDTVSNTWSNSLKTENDYNSNGLIINSLRKEYSKSLNDWVNSYTIDYEHELGELIKETSQYWDTISNEWVNDLNFEMEYNEIGDKTKEQMQVWDTITSQWVNSNLLTIDYNGFFEYELISEQIWDTTLGSWVDTTKASYTYNVLGDISKYIKQAWNGTSWDNVYQETYDYNSQDNLTDITYEVWDDENQKWENLIIEHYEYTTEGYLESIKDDYWNSNTNQWETGYFNEITQSGNYYYEDYYVKNWNDSINKFTGGFRELSEYSMNGLVNEIIYQNWDTTTSSWVNDQKVVFYWSSSLSAEQIELEQISIYPVPFKSSLNIELRDADKQLDIEIYNIQGQKIKELILDKKVNTINLSGLKSGIYFIVYEMENRKLVKKIAKE